jgi:CRP/FNR family transcriptional regulator, cyclic AMP receptor protein
MMPSTLLPFDVNTFLPRGSPARKIAHFGKNQTIFSHGDPSSDLFYIEKGCVKLTMSCRRGNEAIIGVFERGDFFGESCLGLDKPIRFGNAIAITELRAVKIDRKAVIHVLRTEAPVSYSFITYLLARSTRIREDLVDNLLSSSEQRLARVLYRLSKSAAKGSTESSPKVNQQTLGEMIGTTRQRVNFLMQRFRRLGFIEGADGLKVHDALLNLGQND